MDIFIAKLNQEMMENGIKLVIHLLPSPLLKIKIIDLIMFIFFFSKKRKKFDFLSFLFIFSITNFINYF
jgi:hypothetical protein